MTDLIPPYGGKLTSLMAEGPQRDKLLQETTSLPSLALNQRQLCDLELLLNGALSPLTGFMGHADYARVVSEMRLADGSFWPMPITLDTSQAFAATLSLGSRLALRDENGRPLAILTVSDIWQAEKTLEARQIYGTDHADHPGMVGLAQGGCHYVGGRLEGLTLPGHEDFLSLRLTPAAVRNDFVRRRISRVVAFQPHHVMHRPQFEFTLHTAKENGAGLLIQAMAGEIPNPEHFTRIRCYQALLPHYPSNLAQLSLLPLALRPAGVREVLWRAIIARNYGCSHLIIGGDAGPGEIRRGTDALTPERIQPLAEHFAAIGVEPVTFPRLVYVQALGQYMPQEYLPPDQATLSMSARELRQSIRDGRDEIPAWASFPEVVTELRKHQPLRRERGICMLLSGPLATSGTTTLLGNRIMELTGRAISFCRNAECAGLAAEIIKHGGILICHPPTTLDHAQQKVLRKALAPVGGMFVFNLACAAETPEIRPPHGVYTQGRAGGTEQETSFEIKAAGTGNAVEQIIHALRSAGYLA